MIEFRLPNYEVLIHMRYNDFSKSLEEKILTETALYELDESIEDQGMKTFHWGFDTWKEAVSAVNALKKFGENPNLILLKAKANYNTDIEPIIFKDSRKYTSKI